MTNPNDPAFLTIQEWAGGTKTVSAGLTKREHFAAMAMQGLIPTLKSDEAVRLLPTASIKIADALIAELNKGTK